MRSFCDRDKLLKVIRKKLISLFLSTFLLLSACNTVKGTATGASRDIKTIWHYGSCVWDWDKDCQKK